MKTAITILLTISWLFCNNILGQNIFSAQKVISTTVSMPTCIHSVDIDGDNDLDILSASTYNGNVFWIENMDDNGTFNQAKAKIISNDVIHVEAIFPADLDSDGDIDILSAKNLNTIIWIENIDGAGSYSHSHILTQSVAYISDIYAVDIDNDNDIDVFSTSENDNKIAWYENLTNPTSVQNHQFGLRNNFHLFQNYPNPFNPSTTIRFTLQKTEHSSLKIYNTAGQEVAELVDDIRSAGEHQVQWQADGLPSGIYFARLQAGSQMNTKKLFLQK